MILDFKIHLDKRINSEYFILILEKKVKKSFFVTDCS